MGIAGSGGGLGTVAVAPFATYLIANFDWRMAYIVIGAIAGLVIFTSSMLLKGDPGEIGLLSDGAKPAAGKIKLQSKESHAQPADFSIFQALRTRNFRFLWLTWLLQSLSVYLITTHIIPHTTDIGISPLEAAGVLSLIGGGTIIGRLLAGSTSDIVGRKIVAITVALFGAGALIWLMWSRELWMFYLFAVFFGLSWGGLSTTVALLVSDIFRQRSIGRIMGWQGTGWVTGAAIGPALGGIIFDATESYFIAFIISALAMLLTALFMALLTGQTIKQEYVSSA